MAPTASSVPQWSRTLQLSGVTSADGEHCVYLFNTSTGFVTILGLGEPPHGGLKLEAIENESDPARCSAIVSRNGERAVIRPADCTMGSAVNLVADLKVSDTIDEEHPASSEETPVVKEWNGPRFDLEAAKAAATARQANGE